MPPLARPPPAPSCGLSSALQRAGGITPTWPGRGQCCLQPAEEPGCPNPQPLSAFPGEQPPGSSAPAPPHHPHPGLKLPPALLGSPLLPEATSMLSSPGQGACPGGPGWSPGRALPPEWLCSPQPPALTPSGPPASTLPYSHRFYPRLAWHHWRASRGDANESVSLCFPQQLHGLALHGGRAPCPRAGPRAGRERGCPSGLGRVGLTPATGCRQPALCPLLLGCSWS